MESITEAVLRYQDTGSGYKEILQRLSVIIYNYPEKTNILAEEDKSEFFLSFYNRIKGLINNFTYKGIPFETLLFQTLKWHTKTFLGKRKDTNKLMAVDIQEEEIKIKDLLRNSSGDSYIENYKVKLQGKASRKRLLFLVLVDSPNISDGEMKTFSELTGYEYEWLLYLKDTLNNGLFKRSERLMKLREKRNITYMKLLYKQARISEESEPEKKKILKNQIKRLEKSLVDTRYEISRIPCRPTHKEVAELLNVPKGTVDSGLHYFRKKHKTIIDENSYSLFL